MQIGSFGKLVRFEVSDSLVLTLQNLRRDNKGRYEEHKVLGARPRLEYLSPELQTFSCTVHLNASFGVDPFDVMLSLKALCTGGVAERLVIGGVNYGYHILESVSEQWNHSLPDGTVISADVTLNFKEYVK